MSTTITLRLDESFKRALEDAARADGRTLSEFVREVLAAAITEESVEARIGRLRGRLERPQKSDPWRDSLREHNWR